MGPDNVTSMHLAYSDGNRCFLCDLYSPVCSSCKSKNIAFAIVARLSSQRPDNLLFFRETPSFNNGYVSPPAPLFSDYWRAFSFVLLRMEQRFLSSLFSLVTLTKCGLTLRLLMSYIYGAPILDVSRSHTTTQHSR